MLLVAILLGYFDSINTGLGFYFCIMCRGFLQSKNRRLVDVNAINDEL